MTELKKGLHFAKRDTNNTIHHLFVFMLCFPLCAHPKWWRQMAALFEPGLSHVLFFFYSPTAAKCLLIGDHRVSLVTQVAVKNVSVDF